MATVSFHYWAGARAAAGTDAETVTAATVRAAVAEIERRHADPRFTRVVAASSLLIDGLRAGPDDLDRARTGVVRVEVLPPFAGGA